MAERPHGAQGQGLAEGIRRNIAVVHKPLSHARQDALQGSLEHQGPAKGTPAQGMGQIAVHVKMITAAQAERVPCESRQGGEQSISAPHLTALPGHSGVGGTQGTAISRAKALAAAPWQCLVAKESACGDPWP